MLTRTKRLAIAGLIGLHFAAVAPAFAAEGKVNVLQYALSHPTDNARLPAPPALGDSVPKAVKLEQPEGSGGFAYFYYSGRPVIVDLKTRSIVRIGE